MEVPDYEITSDESKTFFTVKVNEGIEHKLALTFLNDILDKNTQAAIKGILLDLRSVRSTESETGQYRFSEELDKMGFPRHVRIACLTSPDDKSHDFVETVAQNRGIAFMIFRDLDKAEEWLRQDSP